ncbi:unnamed protein product, partial [Mesorhabditis spiculigera]
MHVLATNPELYGTLIEAQAIPLFITLLSHENSDIVGATLNLLQELTDVDILNESVEGAEQLVRALLDARIVECIVASFATLNETVKDDADALHNGLTVFENILDFHPAFSQDCVQHGLFQWLLKRATQRGTFDGNKMYASEMLALLLQTSDAAREQLTAKVDGMELLLRALASYKRHDPTSLDEREHMENLFDGLCSSLLHPPNRKKFLDGEGLQLMNLMLRERKQSRESALKVLDHATTGPEGKENCANGKVDKFIQRQNKENTTPADKGDGDKMREYLDRLDGGLYTLQNVTLLLSDICVQLNSARQRAIKLFSMKVRQEKLSAHFIPILSEYAENLGETADEERRRIDTFIARLNAAEKAERKQ